MDGTHLIVAGIFLKDNMFLVEKRTKDDDIDPGLVCFPGGHVENNESIVDAIIRETVSYTHLRAHET